MGSQSATMVKLKDRSHALDIHSSVAQVKAVISMMQSDLATSRRCRGKPLVYSGTSGSQGLEEHKRVVNTEKHEFDYRAIVPDEAWQKIGTLLTTRNPFGDGDSLRSQTLQSQTRPMGLAYTYIGVVEKG